MTFLKNVFFSALFLFPFLSSLASGIHGTVKADDGSPLAYATIFVKQTGTGTTTNADGYYEILLPPGNYELVYQYLGYQTEVRQIEISERFTEMNIIMKTQATLLQTVTVRAGKEDPAYTIMRRVIAKASYHINQIDRYTAEVYIKGTGKLKDYPWIAKRALEKDGVEKGRVYISESVSEIEYTRPNNFKEKVISVNSVGDDNSTSPNRFIFGSFYEPMIAGTVTPFSPKAFSYYRFEYQGTFKDRDYEISKIKVIPRSKGDDVVDGIIYIVEDWWSIHSLDIHTSKLGIDFFTKSMYAPVDDKAWLPVSHQFKIDGKVFGFEFEYNYLATIKDYAIELNPEIYVDQNKMEIIDEKLDKKQAKEIEKNHDKDATQLHERLESGKEITRKELKTLIREYEKQELKQQEDPEVLSNVDFKIDSGANKKDSTYWAIVRPVPLTKEEVRGYEKSDSISAVQKAKAEGDTVKNSKHKGFQPWDILTGDSYNISKHSNFRIYFPLGGFNTVEGWNVIYSLAFGTVLQDTSRTRLMIRPVFRYAFAREKLSGYMNFTLRNKKYHLDVNAGRYITQFNHATPIISVVNTFTTLFLEKNLTKLYERDFANISYKKIIGPFLTVNTDWTWAKRSMLSNSSDFKLVNRKTIEDYTSNKPFNEELPDTGFASHEAVTASVGISARPWVKFRIRNGELNEINNSSPTLSVTFTKGFSAVLDSEVDFDLIELGVKHNVDIGVRGTVHFWVKSGMFLNDREMYFMDYKHFMGNQTPFSTTDPVGSFRLLDYYRFSTSDKYFVANLHYQFRKFLVTTIPYVRLFGIRENIFVNYLATPTSKNYTELGYSIDGILRIFRLEVAAAFLDGQYLDYGFRLGITTGLQFNFGE